jgi:ribonuclease R
MGEIDGVVQGHRDGHGYVLPDAGEPWIYLAPQEMRSVLHKDRVRVRILRQDRKGRPEGRVVDILERRKSPIIGRLLHEGGQWIVAPEDSRYGQDILIPKNATASAAVGQVVSVELTEPPSLHSQPVGRVAEVLGEIDDPGMEIEIAVRKYEVPHQFSTETLALAAALPEKLRPADRKQRVDLTDVALVTIDGEDARDFDDAVYSEPFKQGRGKSGGAGLALAGGDCRCEPLREARRAAGRRRLRARDFGVLSAPRDPDAAREILQRLVFPEPRRSSAWPLVCDMIVKDTDGTVHAFQFYPAVIRSQARLTYTEVAAVLANTRGPEALAPAPIWCRICCTCTRSTVRCSSSAPSGARWTLRRPKRRSSAMTTAASRRSFRAPAPRRTDSSKKPCWRPMCARPSSSPRPSIPALYRVHEGPTPEKRLTLQNQLKALGLGLHLSDEPKPAEIQAIAQAVHGPT